MTLAGHVEQQSAFAAAWESGRMHHAWLLAGPKGLGKATFARAATQHVLAGGKGSTLSHDDRHPALTLLAAGSHPDFRLLERTENERGNLRAEIAVEQVRGLLSLFSTSATFGWRVVIVDAADDLGRASANALLKRLEEPPSNTLFLLVSHNPGRLLPTVRSRCRLLHFKPLADSEVGQVIAAERPDADADEIGALIKVAGGVPGRALRFAGLNIAKLEESLRRLADYGSQADALTLARSLAGKTAAQRYEAFIELAPAFIAERARGQSGAPLARALQLWEKAHALATEAVPLAFDAQAVAFELAGYIADLPRDRTN